MKYLILCIVLLLAFIIHFLQDHDAFTYVIGVITTIVFEAFVFLLILQIRTENRIGSSKLKIQFQEVANAINQITDFQQYIPQDSDRMEDDILSLSEYEPSIPNSLMGEEQEVDDFKDKKSRIHQQANLYYNQLKNYFGSQKLPLQKLNRKQLFSKIQQLSTLTQNIQTYYLNLDRALDPFTQISQISKYILKKDIINEPKSLILLDQLDNNERQIIMTINEMHASLLKNIFQIQNQPIKMPLWGVVRQQVKQLSSIYQQQRTHLQKVVDPQIQSILKAYVDAHKVIKKQKTNLLNKYNELYRKYSSYNGEIQIIEKDLDTQNIIFKEMKRGKTDPQKLIRTEMNIKLLNQQLQTAQHKLSNSKYAFKDIQAEIQSTQQSLIEFKDNWERQYIVLEQTVIRTILQTHYDNYDAYLKSFRYLLRITNSISRETQQIVSPQNIKKQRTSIDDTDPTRLMRAEREELQEYIKSFQNYDDRINQFEKYDSECQQFLVEISESIRRCSSEELKLTIIKQEQDWMMDIFELGFPKHQNFYQNAYLSIKNLITTHNESLQKFFKEVRESQLQVKERLNQLSYLFNCILKDSEKLNASKQIQIVGFTDYQKLKQQFQQSYEQYCEEVEQKKQKLIVYDKKFQQFLVNHNNIITQLKFQTIMILVELSEQIVQHTIGIIDQFDEKYQKSDQIFKSLIQRQSSIQLDGNFIQLDKELFEPNQLKSVNNTSRSGSGAKKQYFSTAQTDQQEKQSCQSLTSIKETFVLHSLIKILFLQWTKSLCFRQKFMTELYRSLNKKRPSQLDEIFVTNIDIGGEPPEVLQFIPQKTSNSATCIFDLELAFRGFFYMELETKIAINLVKKQYPLIVKVKLSSLNGRLRLFYTPSYLGKSWFAFVGEPVMNLSIDPTISGYSISEKFSLSTDIIREFIIYKIKMLTYPNKESIQVPLADYETEIPESALQKISEFVKKLQINQKS